MRTFALFLAVFIVMVAGAAVGVGVWMMADAAGQVLADLWGML